MDKLFAVCAVVILWLFRYTSLPVHSFPLHDEAACDNDACNEAALRLKLNLNETADPCQDFYKFACGGWMASNPLPSGLPMINVPIKVIRENNEKLKVLLEKESDDRTSDSLRKVSDFYRACTNESFRQQDSLLCTLKTSGGWPVIHKDWRKRRWRLERALVKLNLDLGTFPFFYLSVNPDVNRSNKNVIEIKQPWPGYGKVETIEFYSALDERNKQLRHSYVELMVKAAKLLGADNPEKEMKNVLNLEKKLAEVMVSGSKLRNPEIRYETTIGSMTNSKKFNWLKYLRNTFSHQKGRKNVVKKSEVIVAIPKSYIEGVTDIIKQTDKRTLANYVGWRAVLQSIGHLDETFRQIWFDYRKIRYGVTEQQPLWRDCIESVSQTIGWGLGSLFIKEFFNEQSKTEAESMIETFKTEFDTNLDTLDWMSGHTKCEAKEKVKDLLSNVGYPEFVVNQEELDDYYEKLEVDPNNYFQSLISGKRVKRYDQLSFRGKERDRKRWTTTPSTVNAFYHPSYNKMVFPVAILQPPLYHGDYPQYLNFGSIGAIVGHEITHGFDDQGSLYDGEGKVRQWWSEDSRENFNNKTQCIKDQYFSYEIDGNHVNGNLTAGENIADGGSIKFAYNAYKMYEDAHGVEPLLNNLIYTADQYIFIGYAQLYCENVLPSYQAFSLSWETHSPGQFRVNGAMVNSPDFARVFQCPMGSPMNPDKKCSVW